MGSIQQHSKTLWSYDPQTIIRRADGGVGVYASQTAERILETELEARVVCYDIFRTANSTVMAVTPGPHIISSLRLYGRCAGKPVVWRSIGNFRKYECHLFYLQAPKHIPADMPLSLSLNWDHQNLSITIPPNPFLSWKHCDLLQQTMQKDYPEVWIKDHCLFYHRVHGCQRILFYDNASCDRDQLMRMLSSLDENLEIVLVHWPVINTLYFEQHLFRPRRSFSQAAAYVHGFYLFNHLADLMIHFDLDEYLCNRSGMPLVKYMRKHTRLWPGKLVAQLPIAHIPEPNKQYPVRAAHFKCYDKEQTTRYRDSFENPKPFHRTRPALYGLRFLRPSVYGFYPSTHGIHLFGVSIYRLPKLVMRIAFSVTKILLKLRPSKRLIAIRTALSLRVSPEHLIFYHYRGIRTDWDHQLKGLPANQVFYQVREYNPKKYVRTDEMSHVLTHVGLADHSSD